MVIIILGKLLQVFFFLGGGFLGPYPGHMEIPRVGVESELQLLTYSTATDTWDSSRVCNPHHSSQQHLILNLLSKARDQTLVVIATSWVLNR